MDNENFNVEFGEVVNIGGGTSDFNQLSNRPKYNNTPMTGATNIPKVPTKTSELNNDSDYQTGTEVESAISTAIAGKQDTLTAGNNITISNNTISATDTTYTAGTGLSLNGTEFSADTTVLATQTDLSGKQNTLTAGSNITISGDTISATDTTYSNFVGTDGTAAGTAGLVPAPATTDAGKFLKADGTWDTAGGGSANCKELTAADYNYDSNNDEVNDTVALWLLDPGVYWWDYNFADGGGITFTTSSSGTLTNAKLLPYSQQVIIGYYGNDNSGFYKIQAFSRSGLVQDIHFNWAPFIPYIVNTSNGTVVNFQTSAIPVGRGDGGGPTVVQTTGTSTTDVMSQNAVTSMVFADPSTKTKVNIGGSGAAAYSVAIGIRAFSGENNTGESSVAIGNAANTYRGNNGVAIGNTARARSDNAISIGFYAGHPTTDTQYDGAISLGAYSEAHAIGEMNIGSTVTSFGYNNSNYRLISGVYDGQNAHDAATVAQGNTLSTSAPTTSTVGVLGQLYTDTTNMHTYQCTAISGDTYTWTQRW